MHFEDALHIKNWSTCYSKLKVFKEEEGGGVIKTPQNWSDHLLIKKRLKHSIRIHVAKVSKEISP